MAPTRIAGDLLGPAYAICSEFTQNTAPFLVTRSGDLPLFRGPMVTLDEFVAPQAAPAQRAASTQ